MVGFYIKEGIKFSRIDEFSIFHERVFESVCIEVEFSNRKILFISIYRPPGNHPTFSNSEVSSAFLESLNNMFDHIKDKHCYILIDSNFDLLQVEKSPECSNYGCTICIYLFCGCTFCIYLFCGCTVCIYLFCGCTVCIYLFCGCTVCIYLFCGCTVNVHL